MDVQFRRAAAGDLEDMQAVAGRAIDTSYRSFIDDERVDWFIAGPSDRYVRDNIDDSTVAVRDAGIVGFAVCKADLIDLIVIEPEVHRRGIGSALLAYCESQMLGRYDSIRLESFEGNAKANSFYRKNGWTRIGAVYDSMSGARKWILQKQRVR